MPACRKRCIGIILRKSRSCVVFCVLAIVVQMHDHEVLVDVGVNEGDYIKISSCGMVWSDGSSPYDQEYYV